MAEAAWGAGGGGGGGGQLLGWRSWGVRAGSARCSVPQQIKPAPNPVVWAAPVGACPCSVGPLPPLRSLGPAAPCGPTRGVGGPPRKVGLQHVVVDQHPRRPRVLRSQRLLAELARAWAEGGGGGGGGGGVPDALVQWRCCRSSCGATPPPLQRCHPPKPAGPSRRSNPRGIPPTSLHQHDGPLGRPRLVLQRRAGVQGLRHHQRVLGAPRQRRHAAAKRRLHDPAARRWPWGGTSEAETRGQHAGSAVCCKGCHPAQPPHARPPGWAHHPVQRPLQPPAPPAQRALT